jgi:uncharacterized protein GlcG (DUF336 family)
MTKTVLLALAALAAAGAAQAQGPPPPPPRARGPALALAVEAAQASIAACRAYGHNVTALTVDSAGTTVAMVVDDGAPARTIDVAFNKIAVVLKYRVPSSAIVIRAKTDPALAAEIKADPKIGVARDGALPLMAGSDFIGAYTVSGAADKDEICAKVGVDKIGARLK